ncbi:MAG: hypothetical protein NZ942_00670 [Candidatus Aenigmarchaeota archaeon]|nr:hypothetical protein [Candidatus Aenigmarchaeota archaeon]
MIVPTKIVKKENDCEIALMVFPIFEEEKTFYEFHLVKSSCYQTRTLKIKEYKPPLKIEEIAKEFDVKAEVIKELLEKLNYKI